jgi:hypothetical protein
MIACAVLCGVSAPSSRFRCIPSFRMRRRFMAAYAGRGQLAYLSIIVFGDYPFLAVPELQSATIWIMPKNAGESVSTPRPELNPWDDHDGR